MLLDEETIERLTRVQVRYMDHLMALPHVIGVGIGLAQVGGQTTDQPSIVVMVDNKLPLAQLAAEEVVPSELDGVRVDVQAVGVFSA